MMEKYYKIILLFMRIFQRVSVLAKAIFFPTSHETAMCVCVVTAVTSAAIGRPATQQTAPTNLCEV